MVQFRRFRELSLFHRSQTSRTITKKIENATIITAVLQEIFTFFSGTEKFLRRRLLWGRKSRYRPTTRSESSKMSIAVVKSVMAATSGVGARGNPIPGAPRTGPAKSATNAGSIRFKTIWPTVHLPCQQFDDLAAIQFAGGRHRELFHHADTPRHGVGLQASGQMAAQRIRGGVSLHYGH